MCTVSWPEYPVSDEDSPAFESASAPALQCALLLMSVVLLRAQDAVPPLHTQLNQIVDSAGHTIRLTSVNWYGFDEKEFVAGGLDHAPLAEIVDQIKKIGVNSVRLPWANETVERNPVVPAYAVAANPQFRGRHAMEVMDAVISALAKARLMVILDNHVSRADWCCSETDGNGLWYNADYPEDKWLEIRDRIARRYRGQPWVVGADLRNELRNGAAWGGSDPKVDWHAAAERGGAASSSEFKSPHFRGEPTLFDGLYRVRQAAAAIAGGTQAGVFAACVFRRRSPSLSSYEAMKEAYRARAHISFSTREFRFGLGIRELPDAGLRRKRAVAPMVYPAAARGQPVVVELLATQWHAIERCRAQV